MSKQLDSNTCRSSPVVDKGPTPGFRPPVRVRWRGSGRDRGGSGTVTERNWTDSRDGTEWEIKAIPVQGEQDDGDPVPIIGETPYTLRFSSQDGEIHRLPVDPDVGSRLSELSDAELAELLDEARSLP